mmetsp:Transcript_65325/g.211608  ORF Transcript_65325/g.211608 Transcript_65325/m.211608 type:complete len:103 (-) Transcript_65325:2342-2650(-)
MAPSVLPPRPAPLAESSWPCRSPWPSSSSASPKTTTSRDVLVLVVVAVLVVVLVVEVEAVREVWAAVVVVVVLVGEDVRVDVEARSWGQPASPRPLSQRQSR